MAPAVVESSHPGGYSVSSSAESSASSGPGVSNTGLNVHARPNLPRRETDQILSYYQSEHAGKSYPRTHPPPATLARRDSCASNSSSEYSSESLDRNRPVAAVKTAAAVRTSHARRPSVPTQESNDRRRVAIVELADSLPPSVTRKGSGKYGGSGVSSSSALLSRRGLHVNSLALVAPPDASPSTYTNLTPPPTAPVFATNRQGSIPPPSPYSHIRSASEVTSNWSRLHHQSSRDVGIVGTGLISIPIIAERTISDPAVPSGGGQVREDTSGLAVPIFQTPSKSRSPSPANATPDLATTTSMNDPLLNVSTGVRREQTLTPAIGEGKDIGQPVVGPVVIGLNSANILRREPMKPMDTNHTQGAARVTTASSYAHYEPGVHSRAGPLPPPPKAVFDVEMPSVISVPNIAPPPRPPRMRTPVASPITATASQPERVLIRESLHPLASVSNAPTSSDPAGSDLNNSITEGSHISEPSEISGQSKASDSALEPKRSTSIHKREGAFPPSAPNTSTSTPESSPDIDISASIQPVSTMFSVADGAAPRVVSPEPDVIDDVDSDRRSGFELRRENSWISLRQVGASSPNGKAESLREDRSVSSSPSKPSTPLPPPKTVQGVGGDDSRMPPINSPSNPFKATLNNLKRFSALPRTPSSLSMRSAANMDTTSTSSRASSPANPSTPRAQPRQKIINAWPEAMQFREISIMKSPHDRAMAYAAKIQELSTCDTGLSEWVRAMQQRGTGNRSARNSAAHLAPNPSLPSTRLTSTQQPRHTSHGSVDSEATFPTRPDAYTATDLMMRPTDDLSITKIPPSALPYPSLAMSPPVRAATLLPLSPRSYQIPLSNGPRSGAGFFASIGRKASLRRDRAAEGPSSPTRVLTKRGPTSPPNRSATIQINNTPTPTIPGGPRAIPGRMQRSHTLSVAAPPPPVHEAPQVAVTRSDTRSSVASRRPLLFHRSVASPPRAPSDEEFEKQVDKLADLLPHAERKVLASYLRRAGQDILAIGQYLEDEKKGAIRYD